MTGPACDSAQEMRPRRFFRRTGGCGGGKLRSHDRHLRELFQTPLPEEFDYKRQGLDEGRRGRGAERADLTATWPWATGQIALSAVQYSLIPHGLALLGRRRISSSNGIIPDPCAGVSVNGLPARSGAAAKTCGKKSIPALCATPFK